MTTIKLKINGKEITANPGQTILEVVREQDLDQIPTLCHAPELKPYGSCFVCTVEVKGRPNLVPSCATKVAPGMEVETRNDRVNASRKTAFELLLSNHYADCVSPCLTGCPAGVDVQGYLALAGMGEEQKAVELIREANPLPAICGRVCVRKCEVACRRTEVDAPVGINWVKRYLVDTPGIYDQAPVREAEKGKTVGIVGGGPAGLTAAWFLGRKGYKPVIYEANEKAGGMTRYGIPNYRLPDDVMDQEVEHICRAGAEIHYQTRVGKDVTLDELRGKHDAIFLAAGAWTGKAMRVEGEFTTEGVVTGADFLPPLQRDPQPLTGTVVVVGGGNTAMDCARTSWRCGADKVIVLYRRTKAEMPADPMEIHDLLEEGIELMELAAPTGIIAEKGKLKAFRCIRMKLGEPDSSGRRRPVPMEGSEFDLPCQLAISAIGQDTVLDGLTEIDGKAVSLTKWNTYDVDLQTMKSNIPGIFAGGDAADDGPTVVIDAIRDGQRAARAIHGYLSGEEIPAEPFVVTKDFWGTPSKAELGDIPESPRHEINLIDVAERKCFAEVATGFEPEDAAHEVSRCLSCGCVRYDDCDLRLYAQDYGVDMNRFAGYVRKHKVDDRHPYVIYDPNKCVLCSRCIRTCANVLPISALGLVGRGFKAEMRPAMNDPLVQTNCVSCGNCVDACPTGALTVKYPFPGRACLAATTVDTNCAFCSLGCEIKVKSFGDNRYAVSGAEKSGASLCRYGRFGAELFIKHRRTTTPQIRTGSTYNAVDLPTAYGEIVAKLQAAVATHGPEAVAVFASPELTNEELYLAGRIAREGLGTNNIGSLAILATGKESGALDEAFGFTASTADREVLHDADLVICNNTNLQTDHLVLAMDVQKAVKEGGAKLIVTNSTLGMSDTTLSALAMDPMRGRASVLWKGIIQALAEEGYFTKDNLTDLPGSGAFLENLSIDKSTVADLTGVEETSIAKAVALIKAARKVVVIHASDRVLDQAPGDMPTFGSLVLMLRALGVRADLLLPRMNANSAGLVTVGVDPRFLPGRELAKGLPGASSHEEFRTMLKDGKIRAALVIGEDPMRHDRTASFLQNVEFLAAMDWAATETTQFAAVTLPGTTFLEGEGTRVNFEGRLVHFNRAVNPPAGLPGWQVLAGLAEKFDLGKAPVEVAELTREITAKVTAKLGALKPFHWNEGEAPVWSGKGKLVISKVRAKAAAILPPLTHGEAYKREIHDVGTEHFRVH